MRLDYSKSSISELNHDLKFHIHFSFERVYKN